MPKNPPKQREQKKTPEQFKQLFSEMMAMYEFRASTPNRSPEKAKELAENFMKIRGLALQADKEKGITFDEERQQKAFQDTANKFGKNFWGEFKKVPNTFADEKIKQYQEALAGGKMSNSLLEHSYFEMMEIAQRSNKVPKPFVIEKLYFDTKAIIGEERVNRIFRTNAMDTLAPNLAKSFKENELKKAEERMKLEAEEAERQRKLEEAQKAEREKRQKAEREKHTEEVITADVDKKIAAEQLTDEERYEKWADANGILESTFKDDELSDRMNALLEKAENEETEDEVQNDDYSLLKDLKRHTKRLYDYAQGDDKGALDTTIKTIQNRYPNQMDRLFKTLLNDEPGSMMHKDHLEMIQRCGAIMVNTQRFANKAAEQGLTMEGVNTNKEPIDIVRDTLKKFSVELDRIPKDDDNSEHYTRFQEALQAAANGGSLANLLEKSREYFDARVGRFFRPFTEVGRHRLDVADHVYEFLIDVKCKTLEKEAQRKATADAKKETQQSDNQMEKYRAGTQKVKNGEMEQAITRIQEQCDLSREEIETKLKSVINNEVGSSNTDVSPVNEQEMEQSQMEQNQLGNV